MKSQHRHELQTNELGRFAEKSLVAANDFYSTYGNQVLIGIVVVALAASALILRTRSSRHAEAAAWADLANANQAESFATVAEAHPGTNAARWARVHEGEYRLNEGVQLAFTNVESSEKELKLAKKALQSIVDEKGAAREIRERALYALALTLESLSDGNEGEAVKTYEALLREFPDTIYKKQADGRIAALASGSGQEFYEWFAKYPRPKPSEKRPRDRMLGDDRPEDAELDIRDPLELDLNKAAENDPALKLKLPDLEIPGEKPAVEDPPASERKPDESADGKLPP